MMRPLDAVTEAATIAWLERCLDVMALDPETARDSVGLPCGLRRPEYGPSVQDLECCNCGAGWAGIAGDPCEWCERTLDRMQVEQIDLLLATPDVDPADITYDNRMTGWLQRMKIGVEAGLITASQAENAWWRANKEEDGSMMIDDHMRKFHDVFDGPANGVLPVPVVDWATVFDRPIVDAVVDSFLFPGRWTALVAPAKHGKSTLALHVAHRLARGYEPFGVARHPAIPVLYLDGEMGELDVVERLTSLELTPTQLGALHYSDRFPKGDTVQGGAAIVSTAVALAVGVVVLDGLNAFVTGAEKDDTPWRNLFDNTIAPLKRAGIAVLSDDNTGKDATLSAPRGSSVKLDKADAIIELKRTDGGLTLKTTHTRSADYLKVIELAMDGLDGERPIDYRRTVTAWPAGTHEAVKLLDEYGVEFDAGRGKARQILRANNVGIRNEVLSAALKLRRQILTQGRMFNDVERENLSPNQAGQLAGDRPRGQVDENDF